MTNDETPLTGANGENRASDSVASVASCSTRLTILCGDALEQLHERWDEMERKEQCSHTRNKRSVWTVPAANYPEAHFATYPEELIKPCILAGCPAGGVVLDPFAGSGTTGKVALDLGRRAVLIELNPDYVKLIEQRCAVTPGLGL